MKFKKGDRVEVIWRSELIQGVVARISEITNELDIKPDFTSQGTILFNQNQVRKVELVKVPQFVADWIEYCEKYYWELSEALRPAYKDNPMHKKVMGWFEDCRENQELFARAWLDGYEVEQEPLYYVKLISDSVANAGGYLNLNLKSGALWVDTTKGTDLIKTKFTESEIKNMDEKYWAFKVPVEDLEDE